MGYKRRRRIRQQIRGYFAQCEEKGKKYTLSGLKVAVGATGKEWEALFQDRLLRRDMELALERIRDALEQRGDAMAVMLRKELGGTAKPEAEGSTVDVRFGEEGDFGG